MVGRAFLRASPLAIFLFLVDYTDRLTVPDITQVAFLSAVGQQSWFKDGSTLPAVIAHTLIDYAFGP